MKTLTANRLDSSLLSREEMANLSMVLADERPALVGREGVRIELPNAIFHLLVRVIRTMQEGKAIVLLPENEAFTTQAAADFLGVSRPFLVAMIEREEIPHYLVGKHRRIYLKDLIAYMHKRDQQRKQLLNDLASEVEEAGLYEADSEPNERELQGCP